MEHDSYDNKRKNYEDDDDEYVEYNEEDRKRLSHLSYIDRYYTKYYKLDDKCENNPHLLLNHSNRVCLVTLADTHPLLNAELHKIIKIDFLTTVNENMKGKRKHNAQYLQFMQPICTIQSLKLDEIPHKPVTFTVYSLVNAKLIEINEKLLKEPEIVQTRPLTMGYIAILYPKVDNIKKQLAELMTQSDYVNSIASQK